MADANAPPSDELENPLGVFGVTCTHRVIVLLVYYTMKIIAVQNFLQVWKRNRFVYKDMSATNMFSK